MTGINLQSVPTACLASAAAGVAFHGVVQYIELDLILLHALVAASFLLPALIYIDINVYDSTLQFSTLKLACFAFGLTSSILVYRAFFHRLKRFPGPFAARLSKLYAVSLSTGLRYNIELQKLHQKYGDVVRTGPRELSIIRPSAIPAIIECPKNYFYQHTDWRSDHVGLAETRDIEDHQRRKRGWDRALNLKSIEKYEAAIQNAISDLLEIFSSTGGKPFDVTQGMLWLAYDVMGIVGFSRDFGQVRTRGGDKSMAAMREQMKILGFMKHIPWLINVILNIPGVTGMSGFLRKCRQLAEEKQKTWNPDDKSSATQDIISWLLHAYETKASYAPPTLQALDEDTRVTILAGSDTTAGTLANIIYYLTLHPHTYTALQTRLATLFPGGAPTFSYATLARSARGKPALALLDAIIAETLRLKPAIPSGNGRTTPPQGVVLPDGTRLPGSVDVWMPQYVMQRDARHFVEPDAFVPERWMEGSGKEGWVKERSAWWPFYSGMYACPGKQMAYLEMRSVVARMALGFDLKRPGEGEEGAQDWGKFEEETLDTFTLTVAPLRLCFVERGV
ncbi:Cytochrome p450 [Lasiodiplodia theobromae]|uniref:Cytochrome p450 n=1 Tax=Lasiodiplodia theobromae TaxID=45133 RepID=UPI0015C3184D|nr:Cytochrome p450 [Lasiodiplodia theobromae]KAF4534436.1 Cytochrome p450 [Lasiodiplodia theobromae]